MQEQTQKFETWGIVELFGHGKISGLLTEQSIAGANMLRVDVPETENQPAFTRFLNHAAIYAINPVDEITAKSMAERIDSKPIQILDIKEVMQKQNLLSESLPTKTDSGKGSENGEEDQDDDF
jgi:hypothetical protein